MRKRNVHKHKCNSVYVIGVIISTFLVNVL